MSTPPPIEFKDWTASLVEVPDPSGVEAMVVVKDGEARQMKVDGAVAAAHWQMAEGGPLAVTREADNNDFPTNWGDVIDEMTPVLAPGVFEYNAQVIWTLSNANRQGMFRFGIDGSFSNPIRIRPRDSDDRLTTHYRAIGTFPGEEAHRFQVQVLLESRGGPTPTLLLEQALVTLERKRSS